MASGGAGSTQVNRRGQQQVAQTVNRDAAHGVWQVSQTVWQGQLHRPVLSDGIM